MEVTGGQGEGQVSELVEHHELRALAAPSADRIAGPAWPDATTALTIAPERDRGRIPRRPWLG